eukprot:GHVL01022106.1.p1 GENE.GHVL01022106.1~~GHVL01022106.1.p1  ORF type:complete len:641 (+),score=91.92 GHVL01022106.1:810-2732(+)
MGGREPLGGGREPPMGGGNEHNTRVCIPVTVLDQLLDATYFSQNVQVSYQIIQILFERTALPFCEFYCVDALAYYRRFRFLLAIELATCVFAEMSVSTPKGAKYRFGPFTRRQVGNRNSLRIWHFDFKDAYEDKLFEGDYVMVAPTTPQQKVQMGLVLQVFPLRISIPSLPEHEFARFLLPASTDRFVITKVTTRTPIDRSVESLRKVTSKDQPMKSFLPQSIMDVLLSRKAVPSHLSIDSMSYPPVIANIMSSLNSFQIKAVGSALTSEVTLIQGPPGTGKSRTASAIAHAWRAMDPTHPVLAVAYSNVAANNIRDMCIAEGLQCIRVGLGDRNSWDSFEDKSTGGTRYGAIRRNIDAADVVVGTCIGIASDLLTDLTFERVIIDEATQSTEPAALAALSKKSKQIVLIGDHQQLPPTVISETATRKGLSISLFERLNNLNYPKFILQYQYRMHPQINAFPSYYFYDNKVFDMVSPLSRPLPLGFNWPNPMIPVSLVNVMGRGEKTAGPSFSNICEVNEVYQIVRDIINGGIPPDHIGIVTPYDAQKREIIRALSAYMPYQGTRGINMDIDTVDGYQGREREGRVGFLHDRRRLNVMLTRARRGLIVVGDSRTLRTNSHWSAWITWAEGCGIIIDKYIN